MLKGLKQDVSKATGTDNIGPRLLKISAPHIADDITFICKHSIRNSSFPNKWKEAKVSPLHKNGPLEDVNNYRPISILPVLSKVLEKHVHDSFSYYLKNTIYSIRPSQAFDPSIHVKQL